MHNVYCNTHLQEHIIHNGTNSTCFYRGWISVCLAVQWDKKQWVMVCIEAWEHVKEHVAVTIKQWTRATGAVLGLEVGKEAEKTIYWEEQPEMSWELKISEDSRWHERDWKLLTDKWGGNVFITIFNWKSVQAESRKLSESSS